MTFVYRGKSVLIPQHAEVRNTFRPRGKFGPAVQEAIHNTEPWEKGEDPIERVNLPRTVGACAVKLRDKEMPIWGINPFHTAKRPGLSPYILLHLGEDDERATTNIATLELTGTVDRPILARVYPGYYMPPLPWMNSAPKADGGVQACLEYWNTHAFLLVNENRPTEFTSEAPTWYTRPRPIVGN